MKNKYSIILLIITVVFIIACGNQNTGNPLSLNVSVKDKKTDSVIQSAVVIIEMSDGSNYQAAKTDAYGYARLILREEYLNKPIKIIVRADGYDEFSQNADFAKSLPTAISLTQKSGNSQTSSNNSRTTSSNSTSNPPSTPASSPTPPPNTPILHQEYEGFSIDLTRARLVGNSLTIEFKVINNNSTDKRLLVGGSNGGNYGFLGFYSYMFAEGIKVPAQDGLLAGQSGRAGTIIPGNGQTVPAVLKFENVSPNLTAIDSIYLCVSTKDTYPSDKIPFTKITITR